MYLFYILAAILSIGKIVEMIYFVIDDRPDLANEHYQSQLIAQTVSQIAYVSIASLFVATMYQI